MKTIFNNKSADLYNDYATALCLLSDVTKIQGAAKTLDETLTRLLNEYLPNEYQLQHNPPAARHLLCTAIQNDNIICDGKTATAMTKPKVSVSKLLRGCFRDFNVTGLLLDMPAAIFSDAASQSFVPLVKKGCLFVDGVTAGHGEFTHTIQWLLIAAAKSANQIQLTNDVGELYSKAVGIETAVNLLFEKPGVAIPFDKKTMWDLVVDCFLTTATQEEQGETNIIPSPKPKKMIDHYEFSASLFVRNFRAPRMLQYALFGGLPKSEARFSHAAKFLFAVDLPKHAPLLCALLQNRHRNKGLAIDMDEGKFQKFYSKHAQEKAEKAVVQANEGSKAKPKTIEEFLEMTGRKDDQHANFVPVKTK
jgi:hypothetical protein